MITYCTFQLAEHHFAIPVSVVREVVRGLPLTSVPLAPPTVAGLINLRGQVLMAIDAREQLGLDRLDDSSQSAQIVLQLPRETVSLTVDRSGPATTLDPETMCPPPSTTNDNVRQRITGCYPLEDRLLLVLDVPAITKISV
jgi:purine-binding chemotaxis protein CheW